MIANPNGTVNSKSNGQHLPQVRKCQTWRITETTEMNIICSSLLTHIFVPCKPICMELLSINLTAVTFQPYADSCSYLDTHSTGIFGEPSPSKIFPNSQYNSFGFIFSLMTTSFPCLIVLPTLFLQSLPGKYCNTKKHQFLTHNILTAYMNHLTGFGSLSILLLSVLTNILYQNPPLHHSSAVSLLFLSGSNEWLLFLLQLYTT